MTSTQGGEGGSGNTPVLQSNSIQILRAGGSRNPKNVWTSYIEAPLACLAIRLCDYCTDKGCEEAIGIMYVAPKRERRRQLTLNSETALTDSAERLSCCEAPFQSSGRTKHGLMG